MTSQISPSFRSLRKPLFYIFQTVASITVSLLGLIVLIGWHTNNSTLIQISPTFVPMQHNTALAFLLCGVTLFLSAAKFKKIVFFLSLIILGLGLLTFSQYIFDVNIGIDEFFIRHYIDVKTSHPGRMAPNTAICFILSGLALFISKLNFKYVSLTSSLLGAIITALGFVSLFGYLLDMPTAYSWGQLTAMAVHTSFGFVFIGLAIITQMWHRMRLDQINLIYRLPILVAVAGITITVCLWQAIVAQERASIEAATRIESENVKTLIENEISTRVLALERMAERWASRDGTPRVEWERDAKRYINDYGSYKAIEWVDTDFYVRWAIPIEGNEKVIGLKSAFDDPRRIALEASRDNKKSILTQPVELIQGGKGVLIYCPIYNNEKFYGFILGVLEIESLFKSILPKEFKDNYSIKILSQGKDVFQNQTFVQESNSDLFELNIKAEEKIQTLNVEWTAVVSSKQKTSEFMSFSFDKTTLLIGFLITALLAWTIYLYNRSKLDGQAKTVANDKLLKEVKERQRIEQVLRDTTLFREAIVNGTNYMIISTDIDGTILVFNKTAEELLGYKAVELIGKATPEVIHVKDEVIEYAKELSEKEGFDFNPGFETFVAKARVNQVDEREWSYVRKDGTTFPVILSVTALKNDENEITGFLGVSRDISEIKQINQKLLESEKRFKAFMNNSPAAAVIKDDKGRYVFVNRSFEKHFHVKAQDLIGKTNATWLPADELDERRDLEHRVIKEGKHIENTEIITNHDGSLSYWLSIRFPIENPDGSIYMGGVGIDITKIKQLESELKETRDTALESVRLKSEFLANMSHEIRTPMNGVLGMIEILLDTKLNETQLDYALTIQESAESLLTIINDILDFSKIEAGKIVFETIDFDLQTTVENVIGSFAEEATRKNLEIVSLVEMNVQTALRGDPGRLKQVLINLIGNAVKFTNEGSIYVKVSKISETKTRTKLQFNITDTGIGISPETQKYLFQAFTQADGSMTRKYGGTGLGLAISKQLVDLMGGEIKVKSSINKGSVFTFTAHFEKQYDPASLHIEPIKNLRDLRVLIVDDNSTNREIIMHQTNSWGMLGEEASGTNSALKMLNQAYNSGNPFDLAFLDLMMPEIGGFELANLIRKDKRFADLKIILMPSFGKRGHAKDAINSGVDAYLVKPIRQSDLYDCIATVMGIAETEDKNKTEKLITQHTINERRKSKKMRILIAEDNPVNQKVTKNQVQRLGYKSDLVANGFEVLEALKNESYSLILMDCQMPEMDGYQATEEIRRNEGKSERIPIIAITANAMTGEQEKCLAAGMDDYLSKPFKQDDLRVVIEKWLKRSKEVEFAVDNESSQSQKYLPEISERLNELKNEVGEEVVEMIVSLFVEDSILRLKKMNEIIKSGNLEAISQEAHSLKGSASNIGANHVADLCSELEMQAKYISQTKIEEHFSKIESGFFAVFESIETLNSQQGETLMKA